MKKKYINVNPNLKKILINNNEKIKHHVIIHCKKIKIKIIPRLLEYILQEKTIFLFQNCFFVIVLITDCKVYNMLMLFKKVALDTLIDRYY